MHRGLPAGVFFTRGRFVKTCTHIVPLAALVGIPDEEATDAQLA